MAREDIRINLSFKNNDTDRELFEFVNEKGKVIGVSAYIKQLIYRDMMKEKATK